MSKYHRPSFKVLALTWFTALFSCSLVAVCGLAVWQDMASFKSCNVNSTDLSVAVCGKGSLNQSDGLLTILLIGSIIIVLALFTHAWRLTRRPAA